VVAEEWGRKARRALASPRCVGVCRHVSRAAGRRRRVATALVTAVYADVEHAGEVVAGGSSAGTAGTGAGAASVAGTDAVAGAAGAGAASIAGTDAVAVALRSTGTVCLGTGGAGVAFVG